MSENTRKKPILSNHPEKLVLAANGEAGNERPRPFIKWAGGKQRLLPELISRMPDDYYRYFEPFLGGAALFFYLRPKPAFLSDINPSLVNTYQVVKQELDDLILDLKHHVYDKEYFYKIRNSDRVDSFKNWSDIKKASRFIYLNKTCFNGLHRVNSKGQFNTPFGKYTNPTILDQKNLKLCSQALKFARVSTHSFLNIEGKAKAGDFVYFDPPYAPINKTSNFTNFAKEGFGDEMQIALRDLCVRLDQQGVKWMLSNSAVPFIEEIYKDFKIERIRALRAINSKGKSRGKIDEFVIRNY
ncbi:MAG: DNA adenine methylase [Bdellovibrionota bacterium]